MSATAWGEWAAEEMARAGELPSWVTGSDDVADAVRRYDGSCEALDSIWHAIKHAIQDGEITPPTECPE